MHSELFTSMILYHKVGENMENNIPNFLMEKLKKQYKLEDMKRIIKGLNSQRKTTFRINTLKSSKEIIVDILNNSKIMFSEVDWNENAIILENIREKELKELDIYRNGEIYLQSLSSMIPAIILEPKEKENILDMCAAPRRKNITDC